MCAFARSDTFTLTFDLKPKESQKNRPDLAKMRKKEHEVQFAELKSEVPGFLMREYPHMHQFHASSVDGEVRICLSSFPSTSWHDVM